MFLDLVFIVPPLIDKEKKKKKDFALLYKCLSDIFAMNSKGGSYNTIGMASVRFFCYVLFV